MGYIRLMSTTKKGSRKQRLTAWGLAFLYGLFKFNWFTIWAIISTIAVFGSFILITVQALWWNFADVLLPMKIAIPTGYGAVLLHMTRQVIRYSKSKEPEATLVAAIEVTEENPTLQEYPLPPGGAIAFQSLYRLHSRISGSLQLFKLSFSSVRTRFLSML